MEHIHICKICDERSECDTKECWFPAYTICPECDKALNTDLPPSESIYDEDE